MRRKTQVLFYERQDFLNRFKPYQSLSNYQKVFGQKEDFLYTLEQMQKFELEMDFADTETFIPKIKKLLLDCFKAKNLSWTEISEDSVEKFHLKPKKNIIPIQFKSKNDFINLPPSPRGMKPENNFQILRNNPIHYTARLWFRSHGTTWCHLLIGEIKFLTQTQLKTLLYYLTPWLAHRWKFNLALENAQERTKRDPLTGLYNQSFFFNLVEKKITQSQKSETHFSVLFIDIDHFKKINDQYGHWVGSGVLAEFGKLFNSILRQSDLSFRYGGDEFIVLLDGCSGEMATQWAEKIRKTVESHNFYIDKVQVSCTISIGVADYPKDAQTAKDIIQASDRAMYTGKRKSRNMVYKVDF